MFKVYLTIRRCTLNIEIRRSLKLKSKEEFTLLHRLLTDLIKLPLLLALPLLLNTNRVANYVPLTNLIKDLTLRQKV